LLRLLRRLGALLIARLFGSRMIEGGAPNASCSFTLMSSTSTPSRMSGRRWAIGSMPDHQRRIAAPSVFFCARASGDT
jgi:hypothetical protein